MTQLGLKSSLSFITDIKRQSDLFGGATSEVAVNAGTRF